MQSQVNRIILIRRNRVLAFLMIASLISGCGSAGQNVKENTETDSLPQTKQMAETLKQGVIDAEGKNEEISTTKESEVETTQVLEVIDDQREERQQFETELKAAAVKYIENNNEYVPGIDFWLTFFDYDMDGVPEMYLMYAGGGGSLYGSIFKYKNGEFEEITSAGIGEGGFGEFYEVFCNADNEYLFIERCVWTYGGGRDTTVSKYNLKTQSEIFLAYEQLTMTEDGDIGKYEDDQHNEIDKAAYERIINNATEGYHKVEWQYKEINVQKKEDLEQAVEECFNGYKILE